MEGEAVWLWLEAHQLGIEFLSLDIFQYLSWSSPVTLFDNSRSFTLDSLFDEFSRDLLVSFFGHRINAVAVAASDPDARYLLRK